MRPSNIIIDTDGNPIITDFGLAREIESGHTITAPGAAIGTALYMSPEQAEGDPSKIGPATDIYAIGCILYELLTGRPPFEGETAAAILGKKTRERPPSPRAADPSISRDLETVCLKCLARSRHARYPTAGDLAVDLGQHLAGRPIFAKGGAFAGLGSSIRQHPLRTAVVAGAALACAVGLVLWMRGGGRGRTPNDGSRLSSATPVPLAEAKAEIRSYHNINDVLCIAASGDEVWWGIPGGAYRMRTDGTDTMLFRLEGQVTSIAGDARGNWWMVTEGGLRQFDGAHMRRHDQFRAASAQVMPSPATRTGVSGYQYRIVTPRVAASSDGSVFWAAEVPGTAAGFYVARCDGRAWSDCYGQPGNPMRGIDALACDAEGRVWLSGTRTVLIDPRLGAVAAQAPPSWEGDAAEVLAVDRQGTAWFYAGRHGLWTFAGGRWQRQGYHGQDVLAIAVDSRDRKWLASRGRLECWDGQTRTRHACPLLEPNRFRPNGSVVDPRPVRGMGIDGEDRVWIATSHGVVCFDGRTWRRYSLESSLPRRLRGCRIALGPDGKKWIATIEDIYTFDGTNWATVGTHGRNDPDRAARAIAVDQEGRAWITTFHGMSCFDGSTWTDYWRYRRAPEHLGVAIAVGHDGRIWSSAYRGVSVFDHTRWCTYGREDGLGGDYVFAICVDDRNRVWFACGDSAADPGSAGRGISCLDGKKWRRFTKIDGLADDMVNALAAGADGWIWAGTDAGLCAFDGSRWTRVPVDGGTRQPRVTAVVVDHAARVWIGTTHGLSCFDGRQWKSWTTLDYLAGDCIESLAVDVDGCIWAAATSGVSHVVLRRKTD